LHLFNHYFVQYASASRDHYDGQVGDFRDKVSVGLGYNSGSRNIAYKARYRSPALRGSESYRPGEAANCVVRMPDGALLNHYWSYSAILAERTDSALRTTVTV